MPCGQFIVYGPIGPPFKTVFLVLHLCVGVVVLSLSSKDVTNTNQSWNDNNFPHHVGTAVIITSLGQSLSYLKFCFPTRQNIPLIE